MIVDDVLKGLKLCATCGSLSDICPKCPYYRQADCNSKLKEDAASLILQGELNKDTFALLDDQNDMIAELNCWNKLLWRFIHSDKEIEDSFYKFYKIKKKRRTVKMIVKEEIKGSKLWNVPIGGLFKHNDRFFIKCTVNILPNQAHTCCLKEDHHINCVDAKSGNYTYIDDFTFVEYFPERLRLLL